MNIAELTAKAQEAVRGLTNLLCGAADAIAAITGRAAPARSAVAANLAGDIANLGEALIALTALANAGREELSAVIGQAKELPAPTEKAPTDLTDQVEDATEQQAGTALGRFTNNGEMIEDGDRNPVTLGAGAAGTNGTARKGRKRP